MEEEEKQQGDHCRSSRPVSFGHRQNSFSWVELAESYPPKNWRQKLPNSLREKKRKGKQNNAITSDDLWLPHDVSALEVEAWTRSRSTWVAAAAELTEKVTSPAEILWGAAPACYRAMARKLDLAVSGSPYHEPQVLFLTSRADGRPPMRTSRGH